MPEGLSWLAQLTVILVIPGSLLVMVLAPRNVDLSRVALYGFALSTCQVISVSAVLLWFGWFSIPALLLTSAVLTAVLIVYGVLAGRLTRQCARDLISRDSIRLAIAPAAVVLIVVLVGVLTPHWNFLLGSNMDAGNYEVYGNHFVRTGSYFLESDVLASTDIPAAWIEAGNTWNVIPGSNLAKPSHFPAFPILLALFKGVFDSTLASTLVPISLAAVSAGLLARSASFLARRQLLAALLVVVTVLTPVFFFYSKQIMSECVALLGMSLMVDILVRHRSWTRVEVGLMGWGLGAGIFLALTSKLDAFILLALLPVGLVLTGLETAALEDRTPLTTKSMLIGVALPSLVGTLAGTLLVGLLVDPGYGSKLVPGSLREFLSTPVVIILYGAGFGLALVVAILIMAKLDAGASAQKGPRRSVTRFTSLLYPWLAGLWAVFVLWNAFYRPLTPFDVNHDAHNLLRLFDVVDPLLMTVFLLASVSVLLSKGADRPVLLMLTIWLALLILDSRHSRTELWWMRRYLFVIVPAVVVSISGGLRRLLAVSAGPTSRKNGSGVFALITALLVGTMVLRAVDMRPLLRLEYNATIPAELDELSSMLSEGDVVVIPIGNPGVSALVNGKRSIDGQPLLSNVPEDRVPEAIEVAREMGSRVIVAADSDTDLPPALAEFDLRRLGSATVTEPGVGYLAHVRMKPDRAFVIPYDLYALK